MDILVIKGNIYSKSQSCALVSLELRIRPNPDVLFPEGRIRVLFLLEGWNRIQVKPSRIRPPGLNAYWANLCLSTKDILSRAENAKRGSIALQMYAI